MKFNYARSEHENVLIKTFGDVTIHSPDSQATSCVIMAFVNRSGSNHIADLLKTTGRFVGFDEILNDFHIRTMSEKYQSKTFVEYLMRIRKEQVQFPGQVWGIKAGWAQLAMLARTGLIPNLLTPKVILVKRRDLLGQAISLSIAEQTQKWTNLDPNRVGEIVYDAQRVLVHMRSISNSYAALEQVLGVLMLPTQTVVYEEFLDRPNDIISRLGLALSGDGGLPRIDKARLSPQRDEITEDFKQKFRQDALSINWIGQ